MEGTGKSAARRVLRPLTASLVLAFLGAMLLSGAASAAGHEGPGTSARPGRPTAKAPEGAITQVTPTFRWGRVSGGATYELRVYEGSALLLKKAGITKPSWKSSVALPLNATLIWKVRAANAGDAGAWSTSLSFTVLPAPVPSPYKDITAFSFQGLTPPVIGSIDQTAHTISLTVPYGTPVSALVATFTTSGASVKARGITQVSGTTANTFSKPVTYTVTASDASTQTYVVTVTVTPDAPKAITAFSFQALSPPAIGIIKEATRKIGLFVPNGTPVTALVATYTTTGASVRVGNTLQVSGTTANDFSTPLTYTVTAGDGTTRAYVVTVAFGALAIGDYYRGGKVAYFLLPEDPGYDAGSQHGLIAAVADLSVTTTWSNVTAVLLGTTGTALGTGRANTAAIVAQAGCTGGAAYLCDHLVEGDYSDWYLPSKDELNKLYLNRVAIGGFGLNWMDYYWSSSEYGASSAWYQSFLGSGSQGNASKGAQGIPGRVRAVRAF